MISSEEMISLEEELETSERRFNTSVGSADTKGYFVLWLTFASVTICSHQQQLFGSEYT